MKVYHSAFSLNEKYIHLLGNKKFRILRSFYGNKKPERPSYCNGLFLDSGAFSAFKSNAKINLNNYISFLGINANAFDVYSNLDVIGDAEATWRNQTIMEKEGLNPLPTFHYGEKFKYLKFYVKNYSYIALGGMVPISGKSALIIWLRDCWKIIGNNKIKIHGFGMTDLKLIKIYPWYSIDSTTACRAGRIGVLITPWGQVSISKGLKTKTITTPKKIELVYNWVNRFIPGIINNWEDITNATKEASQLRIIINALFIESEAKKSINKLNELQHGFF